MVQQNAPFYSMFTFINLPLPSEPTSTEVSIIGGVTDAQYLEFSYTVADAQINLKQSKASGKVFMFFNEQHARTLN